VSPLFQLLPILLGDGGVDDVGDAGLLQSSPLLDMDRALTLFPRDPFLGGHCGHLHSGSRRQINRYLQSSSEGEAVRPLVLPCFFLLLVMIEM
jgi:hypothetical protein